MKRGGYKNVNESDNTARAYETVEEERPRLGEVLACVPTVGGGGGSALQDHTPSKSPEYV